jgi:hypothetical protein
MTVTFAGNASFGPSHAAKLLQTVTIMFKGICMVAFVHKHWLANVFNISLSGTTSDNSTSKGGNKPME